MGKFHRFDVDDACVYGITPAIMLNEVKWLLANRGVMTRNGVKASLNIDIAMTFWPYLSNEDVMVAASVINSESPYHVDIEGGMFTCSISFCGDDSE